MEVSLSLLPVLCLGLKSTIKVCLHRISEDSVSRAKQVTVEIFKVLWNIGCFDIIVFFKLFDAQIVSVLLYGSELRGCFDCPNVEKEHMYTCKRILGIFFRKSKPHGIGRAWNTPPVCSGTHKICEVLAKIKKKPKQNKKKTKKTTQ